MDSAVLAENLTLIQTLQSGNSITSLFSDDLMLLYIMKSSLYVTSFLFECLSVYIKIICHVRRRSLASKVEPNHLLSSFTAHHLLSDTAQHNKSAHYRESSHDIRVVYFPFSVMSSGALNLS